MIKQPQAGIRIYNYIDRLGVNFYKGVSESQDTEEVIKIKNEIISISVTKHKAQPSGDFQVILAPNINWLSKISPGSWISIHMTDVKVNDDALFSFSEQSLKMIGRIDTVRMSMRVDPTTGARQTLYTIAGRDWGQVFESIMYIDPLLQKDINNVATIFYSEKYNSLINKTDTGGILSTSQLIEIILQIWGESPVVKNNEELNSSGRFINTQSPFEVPKQLSNDLKFKSTSLSKSISLTTGKLFGDDQYDDSAPESFGLGNPMALIGANTIWQVLSAHMCEQINEMFCDLRWEKDPFSKTSNSVPNLTLYKRVKPFALNCIPYEDSRTRSDFFYIQKTEIPKESIVSLECGDNWRDRINAIEIMPGNPPSTQNSILEKYGQSLKFKAQQSDPVAVKREGLRPLLMQSFFYPLSNDKSNSLDVTVWLPTFIDWYFNTHKMFNGNVSFVGFSKYIPVGSNIVLDSSVFSKAPYVKNQNKNSKFLAHVESVSYNFSVSPDGARSFACGVNFVRGVFVDSSIKNLTDPDSFAIDSSALEILSEKESVIGMYLN